MAENAPENLPIIDIDFDIRQLATERDLPEAAVVRCTAFYPMSGPLLRAALERAADGTLAGEDDERLFFRALFIVGARRDPLGFAPLLRFLRRPQDEVDLLLGDAVAEHLACIAAGTFDGNVEGLFDAIADLAVGEFVRDALLGAATFLTWEGRIELSRFVSFLRRFDSERLAPDQDMAWIGWTMAVALLGLGDLAPAVEAAQKRDSIPEGFIDRREFAAELARAKRKPDDIGRFHDANLGHIDNVLEVLSELPDDDWEDDDDTSSVLDAPGPGTPVVNPLRGVGRNDPCPCGSGKKAKRCCLAA